MGYGVHIQNDDGQRFDVISGVRVRDGFPLGGVQLLVEELKITMDAGTAQRIGTMLIAAGEAARGDSALYEKLFGEGMPQEDITNLLNELGERRNKQLEKELEK